MWPYRDMPRVLRDRYGARQTRVSDLPWADYSGRQGFLCGCPRRGRLSESHVRRTGCFVVFIGGGRSIDSPVARCPTCRGAHQRSTRTPASAGAASAGTVNSDVGSVGCADRSSNRRRQQQLQRRGLQQKKRLHTVMTDEHTLGLPSGALFVRRPTCAGSPPPPSSSP